MSILTEEEVMPFDIYFASIVGMHQHPGSRRDGAEPKTIEESAKLALDMIYVRRAVMGEGHD